MEENGKPPRAPMSPKKKKGLKKKLKPIKKHNSSSSIDDKVSVPDLLKKTMVKSLSMPALSATLLVSHTRLVANADAEEDADSQMSLDRINSQRSWGSNSADGSEYTSTSRLTQRELVHEIQVRAARHLEPPAFVTPIDELHPTVLSWNHKVPRNFNKLKPQVNILGCMHPMELILAQADMRSRDQQEKAEARKKICEEKVRMIDEAIQLKYTRAERYAMALKLKQRQMEWMKIIKLCVYLQEVSGQVKHHIASGASFSHTIRAALVIRQACKRFMRRHLLTKFKFKFMVLFKKREYVFRIGMRIKRKENAVHRIRTFLTEYKNHHRMNVVVHLYLTGVRKVQRNIRDFIACKHAKISVLAVLWARLEKGYVKSMLDQRKLQKRSTGKIRAGSKGDFADLDQKTLIEMKNQAKLWDRIDSKMEDKIKSLKATGVIATENDEEQAEKYMLPARRRWQALHDMLQFLRKEFYQSQRAVIRKKMDSEAAFSESHALDLLRGRNEDIARIVMEKFDKKLVHMKYKPFMLFSSLNKNLIMERIMQAHATNETFAIKINDFSNYSKKYAKRQQSKEQALAASAEAAAKAVKTRIAEEDGGEDGDFFK